MGQPVASIGDSTTGHSCWPTTNICQGASTMVVQGKSPSRVGDAAVPHTCTRDPYPTHSLVISKGSSSVIYENMPVARIGDDMSCTDIIASGNNTIIIGG